MENNSSLNKRGVNTKVKICGLKRPQDILAVNKIEPDYIGFVFAASSRRVSFDQAAALKRLLSPKIQAVGVFVDGDLREIQEIAYRGIIDCIQLHGNETPKMVRAVKDASGLPVIKAIRIKNQSDFECCASYPCDYLLFDTFTKGRYGGSGKQFDWSLIPGGLPPFFLAGGLTPSQEILRDAVSTGAYCLDVSSAVETDGSKDPCKIERFVKGVRLAASLAETTIDSETEEKTR